MTHTRAPGPPSGRFVLRIDRGLHAALRRAAAASGLSLNDYCASKLLLPTGDLATWRGAGQAVARAADLLGDSLSGIVVFGSWARGELRADSDIDLLVVVDRRVKLTRGLYRRWDERPIDWEGHRIEPHFVHLPEAGQIASLWAEVAIDGVLLFAPDPELPRRLAGLRRAVAEGRIVRRIVHGQPYWVKAA